MLKLVPRYSLNFMTFSGFPTLVISPACIKTSPGGKGCFIRCMTLCVSDTHTNRTLSGNTGVSNGSGSIL